MPSVASMDPFRLTPSMQVAVTPATTPLQGVPDGAQKVGNPQVAMADPTGSTPPGGGPGAAVDCASHSTNVPRSTPGLDVIETSSAEPRPMARVLASRKSSATVIASLYERFSEFAYVICGMARTARTPTMMTTTISSTRVNPRTSRLERTY